MKKSIQENAKVLQRLQEQIFDLATSANGGKEFNETFIEGMLKRLQQHAFELANAASDVQEQSDYRAAGVAIGEAIEKINGSQ